MSIIKKRISPIRLNNVLESLENTEYNFASFGMTPEASPPIIRILELSAMQKASLSDFGKRKVVVTEALTAKLIDTIFNDTNGTIINANCKIAYIYENGILNLINEGEDISICLVAII